MLAALQPSAISIFDNDAQKYVYFPSETFTRLRDIEYLSVNNRPHVQTREGAIFHEKL
jgi:hypothetical protein